MALGLQKFEIILDNPDNTFSPGEIITGKIIVELGRVKSIRGLRIRIKGTAEVKWNESSGSGKDNRTTWYTGNEQYFRTEYYLIGGSGGSENVEIQPGHHVYPFEFCLPHNIPSSFEQTNGSVRYTIKAVIDRPWKFDHQASISFTVEAPYYLTQSANSMDVIEDEEDNTFCCFPCLYMGSMKVHVYVPTKGYAIGDAINAKIDIDNNSPKVDVTRVKLSMEQEIKLYSRIPYSKTKTHRDVIQKVVKSGPFGKKAEIIMNMQVPALPSSKLLHCSIIDIEYHLNIKISVSGCHCSSTYSYPIVIGTKPALDFQSDNTHMVPGLVENPPFESVLPNAPTAPFLVDETSMPTEKIPFPMPMVDYQFTGPIPFGMNPADQSNLPPGPSRSTTSGFQYPPATSPAIGFVYPSPTPPTTVTGFTEKPPPSYDDCMRTGKN